MSIRRAVCGVMLAGLALGAAPPRPNVDQLGDPLPPGAIARLGTRRMAGGAEALAFFPDGKRVALGYRDRLTVCEVRDGKVLMRTPLYGLADADQVVCSRDGKRVASLETSGRVRAWDAHSGRLLFDRDGPGVVQPEIARAIGWLSDGRTLFYHDGERVRLFDTASGKERPTPVGLPKGFGAALSADGKTLVLIDSDRGLGVWDMGTGKRRVKLSPVWWDPSRLAVSADGKTVAAGQFEKTSGGYALFDVASGKRTCWLKLDGAVHSRAAFSPDGKSLAVFRDRELVRIYDVKSGELKASRRIQYDDAWVRDVAFTQDNRPVAVNSRLRPVLVSTGEPLCRLPGHSDKPSSIAVSPDGREAFSLCLEGLLCWWDLPTGKLRGTLVRDTGEGQGLALSPDGKLLIAVTKARLCVWRRAGDKFTQLWAGQPRWGWGAFSPDSKVIAQGSNDGVCLLDARTGRSLKEIAIPRGVGSLDFFPDGRLAIGDWSERTVRVFAAGKEIRSAPWRGEARHHPFSEIRILPDGRSLLANPQDGFPSLYEVATGRLRHEYRVKGKPTAYSRLSPDGRWLAILRFDDQFEIRSVIGSQSRTIGGHEGMVTNVAFDRAGRRLVTASYDGTILVWDRKAIDPPQAAPAVRLTDEQLKASWRELADPDPGTAFRALSDLLSRPAQAVALVRARLRAVPLLKPGRLEQLIRDLDDEDHATREKGSEALAELGELARSALERATSKEASLEVRLRVARLLQLLSPVPKGEAIRGIRCVELLEWISDEAARKALETLAKGEPAARLTIEAKASLRRLKERDSASR